MIFALCALLNEQLRAGEHEHRNGQVLLGNAVSFHLLDGKQRAVLGDGRDDDFFAHD
jgi:hypothetical protein